jgi:hypothetical protein
LIQTPGRANVAGVVFGLSKLKTTGRIGRKNRPNGIHREVPIKVTAWIDEGVVPLVLALNEFEDVMTVASCEEGPRGGSYVLFRHRDGDGTGLAGRLVGLLLPHDGKIDYLLRAEWRPGASEPLLELACPREQVDHVAGLLSAARRRP